MKKIREALRGYILPCALLQTLITLVVAGGYAYGLDGMAELPRKDMGIVSTFADNDRVPVARFEPAGKSMSIGDWNTHETIQRTIDSQDMPPAAEQIQEDGTSGDRVRRRSVCSFFVGVGNVGVHGRCMFRR